MTEKAQRIPIVSPELRQFTVFVQDGRAFIYDERRQSLSDPDYKLLRRALISSHPDITEHETSLFESSAIRDFIFESKWFFPGGGDQVRTVTPCVYFIQHFRGERPVYKIGQTNNIARREKEIGGPVMAYACTSRYREFERALHTTFCDYRYGREEWFDFSIINRFIIWLMEHGR